MHVTKDSGMLVADYTGYKLFSKGSVSEIEIEIDEDRNIIRFQFEVTASFRGVTDGTSKLKSTRMAMFKFMQWKSAVCKINFTAAEEQQTQKLKSFAELTILRSFETFPVFSLML